MLPSLVQARRRCARNRSYSGRHAASISASGCGSGARCAPASGAGSGSNPVERSTRSYQCRAQTPSVSRRPAGHAQHPVVESDAERAAQRTQQPFRIAQQVRAVDHGWHAARRRDHVVEDLDLLRQAGGQQVEALQLLAERGDHLARIADQERVGERVEPAAVHVRQQVVRHLLLVVNAHVRRQGAEQRRDDPAPVGLVARDDFVAPGVGQPGDLQVVRIERLVDDERVGAIAPGAHERGRYVARPRPHGEPQHAIYRFSHLPRSRTLRGGCRARHLRARASGTGRRTGRSGRGSTRRTRAWCGRPRDAPARRSRRRTRSRRARNRA